MRRRIWKYLTLGRCPVNLLFLLSLQKEKRHFLLLLLTRFKGSRVVYPSESLRSGCEDEIWCAGESLGGETLKNKERENGRGESHWSETLGGEKVLVEGVGGFGAAFFKKIYLFLFLSVLGLRFCARAFSSCGELGPLFIAVRGPLTIAASLVAEHRLQTRRLSSCGSQA